MHPPDPAAMSRLLRREFAGLRLAGEVDWPAMLLLAVYLERQVGSSDAEALLEMWVRTILAQNRDGQRGVRQLVGQFWPSSSRLHWCDFRPDALEDYFRWHSAKGALTTEVPPLSARWGEWRNRVAVVEGGQVPAMLRRHPEWLSVFLMTYPHRANRSLSAFADAVLGQRAQAQHRRLCPRRPCRRPGLAEKWPGQSAVKGMTNPKRLKRIGKTPARQDRRRHTMPLPLHAPIGRNRRGVQDDLSGVRRATKKARISPGLS